MNTLKDLITEAYELFSPYSLGDEIAVCTACCLSYKAKQELLSKNVNDLHKDTIYQYLSAANNDDELLIKQMRYLLPRILELIITDQEVAIDNEIALRGLKCDFSIWLGTELNFLNRFAIAYYDNQCTKSLASIVGTIVMFDNAKLENNLINSFGTTMLSRKDDICILQNLAFMISRGIFSHFASDELNQKFIDVIREPKVINELLLYILLYMEKNDLKQEERNALEEAFDIFMSIDTNNI